MGNRNAERHGAYSQSLERIESIGDAVEDVERRLTWIGKYLDETEDLDSEQVFAALALYGQMVSRYGRLLRDQRALVGGAIDDFLGLVGAAIDLAKTEMGYPVELGEEG